MLGEPYTLEYTEQFRDDLSDAVRYIVQELRNPDAAQSLKDKVSSDILERSFAPTSVAPYFVDEATGDVYYPIYTGNFITFYVVMDKVMEVRRFIYARRDMNRQLP